MRATWLCRIVVAVAGSMISGVALSQTPDIVLFQGNGGLIWTNSNTNLYYQVEWAASLTGSNVWNSTYSSMTDIRSSGSLVTSSVPMFYRVSGTSNQLGYLAPVPKTGQTNSYVANDDGAYEKGAESPSPRFTVGAGVSSNCVTDNLTGLMWLRTSAGKMGWAAAITNCEGLDGNDGRGGFSDWRLPNIKELLSLIDFGQGFPAVFAALPPGHPFTGIEMEFIMSSTTDAGDTNQIWGLYTSSGDLDRELRTAGDTVWPVRGRQ